MQQITFMSNSTLQLFFSTKLNTICASIHAKIVVVVIWVKLTVKTQIYHSQAVLSRLKTDNKQRTSSILCNATWKIAYNCLWRHYWWRHHTRKSRNGCVESKLFLRHVNRNLNIKNLLKSRVVHVCFRFQMNWLSIIACSTFSITSCMDVAA